MRELHMDLSNYEQILFSEKATNRSVTKGGYKVGDFLVVSYVNPSQRREEYEQWRVYRSQDGLPAIDTTFKTPQDAIRFAEWLEEIYGDFFWIWNEYLHAEIFRWTYLTIENGEEYWQYLEGLKDKRDIEWRKSCIDKAIF
jgi:hypothetical protein